MKEFKLVHQLNNFWSIQTMEGRELTRRRIVEPMDAIYWCLHYCSSFRVYNFYVDSEKHNWYNKGYKEILNGIER